MLNSNSSLLSQQVEALSKMDHCPLCNAPKAERHTRGPLTTQLSPPGAWWKGKPLLVTGYQLQLLDLFCRLGKASHFAVQAIGAGENAAPATIQTVICGLRKKLPNGARIISIFGWGYELILTTDGEGT